MSESFWNGFELNNIVDDSSLYSDIKPIEDLLLEVGYIGVDNICVIDDDDIGYGSLPFFEDFEISNPVKRKNESVNVVMDICVKKMKKNEAIYEIDEYLRDYESYEEIEVVKCEVTNSVNMYMERSKNESVDIYESKYFKKPKMLSKKTGIRDVDFVNNDSFQYCILYDYLLEMKEKDNKCKIKKNYRIDKKVKELDKIYNKVNFSHLTYSVNPLDKIGIDEFERDNRISITIFGIENDKMIVLRKSENYQSDKHIFLLYIKFSSKCGRYYYVNNPKSVLSEIYEDKKNLKNYDYCSHCLSVFKNRTCLNDHHCK